MITYRCRGDNFINKWITARLLLCMYARKLLSRIPGCAVQSDVQNDICFVMAQFYGVSAVEKQSRVN